MAKQIKKSIPWFIILVLAGLATGLVSLDFRNAGVRADDATSTATVLNVVPAFSVNPVEDPASATASPTLVGANVTFKATATDDNNDNYYLAICTTDAVTAGAGGGAPTCDGGAWCVSASTASSTQATCAYTVLTGDATQEPWWGFVCDAAASGQLCSASSQGAGDSGSPFQVNHRPTFTAFADDSPKNPGQTVTWTTTASDPDGDTVSLYVCKANDFTGLACGAGGTWCSALAAVNNPTCNVAMATPMQDKNWEAYGFIIDSNNLAATGGSQSTDSVLTVSNVAPGVTAATIQLLDTDEAGDLTLTAPNGQTDGFKVKFTVTDNNSCLNAAAGNEIASSSIYVYRSGVLQANCQLSGDYDANDCYPSAYAPWNASTTCTQDVGSCTGAADSDAAWTCTFPLQYHADPTVVSSQYPAENWLASVIAHDDNAASSALTEDLIGNDVDMFMAYDLTTAAIAYGSLALGADSVQATTTVRALGNVGLDENLSGINMTSGANSIAVGQQHYSLVNGFAWAAGTALTGGAVESELNCPKTIVTGSPASQSSYWRLRVPALQASGTYTGTNTVAGVTGEAVSW